MPSITAKEYYPRDGSTFSKVDAQKIGPVLEELAEERGLTARDVLDAAHSTNSPLHEYFEWNNDKAADLYRLDQARQIIRSIRVRYTDAGGEVRDVRAFQINKVSAFESDARTYRSFQVLHGDSAFAVQMLGSAFDDLTGWKRKYEPYVFMWEDFGGCLQQVVNQIGEWAEEYKAQAIAPETDTGLKKLLDWRDESEVMLQAWTTCREQIGYIMEAIGEAEGAFRRLDLKRERTCIKCNKPFKSESVGNRICKPCSKSQKMQSGVGNGAIDYQ